MDPTDFTNSPFTSPQQVELLRRYAAQLLTPMEPSQIAPHWTGALAAGLRGALGPIIANQATHLQQLGLQGAAQQDPNLRMLQARGLLGQTAPTSVPGQSAQPMSFAGTPDLKSSILQQESGNNPNIGNSVSGAVGPGQIMPATFSQFAKPGENIANPEDNRNVSGRILDTYMQQYGDPARAAVAYFSGPGNVASPDSPTPWKRDVADPNGKKVSSYVSDVVGRIGGQQVAQAGPSYSDYQHNPWANPKEQDLARGLITPAPYEDVYKQPGYISPMGGARAAPVQGLQPGALVPATVGAEGQISTQVPLTPPGRGTAPSLQGQMQPLMDVAKSMGQQGAQLRGTTEQVKSDVQQAYATIPIIQTLAQMKDTVLSHGDKMIWGPTSDWVNNLRRGLAQHAPGFLSKKDIDGIAAADDFDKLSTQLQTLVGRQAGSTDMSLLQGIKSVPGSHNSKEGAMALIDMLMQTVGLNGQFMAQNQHRIGQPGFDYLNEKNRFFEQNPIRNPITQNPIRLELGRNKPVVGGETRVLNGKTYTKINGQWHEGL